MIPKPDLFYITDIDKFSFSFHPSRAPLIIRKWYMIKYFNKTQIPLECVPLSKMHITQIQHVLDHFEYIFFIKRVVYNLALVVIQNGIVVLKLEKCVVNHMSKVHHS